MSPEPTPKRKILYRPGEGFFHWLWLSSEGRVLVGPYPSVDAILHPRPHEVVPYEKRPLPHKGRFRWQPHKERTRWLRHMRLYRTKSAPDF